MQQADAVVVGAGPAGLAAALELARAGADVLVVDEQPLPGGQIYRQPPSSFRVGASRARGRYAAGKELVARAAATEGIRWLHETTAWGVFDVDEAGVELAVAGADGAGRIAATRLILAPGAYDLPVALPGWTLPGVMGAGAVQAFVKSQQLVPGERFVLAGAHPLLLVVADQLLEAGATLVAVVLAQPRPGIGGATGDLARMRGSWTRLRELAGPLARLRRARVPLAFSTLPVAVEGVSAVEGVRLARVDDDWRVLDAGRVVACDTLALGFGFVPSSELARQAGCAYGWQPGAGGWVVEHDQWMQTSVAAVAVAGEITGVAGADQAFEEGRLAALGVLRGLGRLGPDEAASRAALVRRRLVRHRRFSALVQRRFAPRTEALAAIVTDETVVCRCEEITAGRLRAALLANAHLGTLDAVKLQTRVGMGRCQGRMCQPVVTELVASATGRRPDELGPYRARPPVKPIGLAALAAEHDA